MMSRRFQSSALGALVVVACALCGGASANASLPLHSLGKPTKRRVHLSLDGREIAPPVAVIRLDLDQPANVVSALPKDPPRVVQPSLDDPPAPFVAPHPRVLHDDLEAATTFTVATPEPSTARYIREEL
jgi:hypothetical protein